MVKFEIPSELIWGQTVTFNVPLPPTLMDSFNSIFKNILSEDTCKIVELELAKHEVLEALGKYD